MTSGWAWAGRVQPSNVKLLNISTVEPLRCPSCGGTITEKVGPGTYSCGCGFAFAPQEAITV